MAIGARSQAAKTYLEKHFESFPPLGLDELVRHGLKALQGSVAEGDLTGDNCTVAVVGQDTRFEVLEGEALARHLEAVAGGDGDAGAGGAMETD